MPVKCGESTQTERRGRWLSESKFVFDAFGTYNFFIGTYFKGLIISAQENALGAISCTTGNADCVNDIAAAGQFIHDHNTFQDECFLQLCLSHTTYIPPIL